MHILRVRGARDKCDCCDSRLKSRVQGLCSAGYGVATSDLNQDVFFSFFLMPCIAQLFVMIDVL